MKCKQTLSILLLWFCVSIPVQGQNLMFFGFDQNFSTIESRLSELQDASILLAESNRFLEVRINDATYKYHFYRGQLYRVDMEKVFNRKKEAKKAFGTCFKYLNTIEAMPLDSKNSTQPERFTASKKGKWYDLELIQPTNSATKLRLSTQFPPNTPLQHWTHFDYQVEQDEAFHSQVFLSGLYRAGRKF